MVRAPLVLIRARWVFVEVLGQRANRGEFSRHFIMTVFKQSRCEMMSYRTPEMSSTRILLSQKQRYSKLKLAQVTGFVVVLLITFFDTACGDWKGRHGVELTRQQQDQPAGLLARLVLTCAGHRRASLAFQDRGEEMHGPDLHGLGGEAFGGRQVWGRVFLFRVRPPGMWQA